MQVSGPLKEDTVTVPKIAAVERREARVPLANGTRHLSKGAGLGRSAFRRSASLRGGQETIGESRDAEQNELAIRGHLPSGAEDMRATQTRKEGANCGWRFVRSERTLNARQQHPRARA